MADLVNAVTSAYGANTQSVTHTTDSKASQALDMTDFLQLMVATFQNQSIDNTADISDMMNQMVQMSVVQTVTNLNTLITNTMNQSYAASLLGKEVTISQQSGRNVTNITGVVTGTGLYNGDQVVYIGDKRYALTDVIGVGKLPESDAASMANAKAAETLDDLDDYYNYNNIPDNANADDINNNINAADSDINAPEQADDNINTPEQADNNMNNNQDNMDAAEKGAESEAAENQSSEAISDAGEPDPGDELNPYRVTDYDPATGAMVG